MAKPKQAIDIRASLQETLFGRLSPQLLDEIVTSSRVERYDVATLLNAAGTQLEWLRLVIEGHIEIIVRRANGKEVTLGDIGPRGWATWLPCFIPKAPEYDFVAGGGSCFIAIPVHVVRRFCEEHPQMYPWIIAEIGLRLRLLMDWTGQSVLVGPEQRMAKLILILARDQKLSGNSGTLMANQTRLANLARCSRQTANALLSGLEKKGLLNLAYGKLEILDMAKLATLADADVES